MLIRKLYLQVMDIIWKMKCYVCSKKIRRVKKHDGNYSNFYILAHYINSDEKAYVHKYDDYSKPFYSRMVEPEYNVMVCCKCYSKSKKGIIKIPNYIPRQQYKDYLKAKL